MKKTVSIILAVLLLAGCVAAVGAFAADESYVTDGLVAFYDAGQQKAGDTTWADLAGDNDIADVPNTAGQNEFKDGVYLNTATQVNFPQGIVDLIKGEEFTTEMQLGATQVTGDTWGTYLNAATDAYSLFYRLQDDAIEFKNGSNARPCKQEIGGKDALSDSTITVVFKVGEPSKIYINGELAAEAPSAATAALAVEDYFGDGDGDDVSSGAPVSSAAPVESSTDAPVSSSAPTSSTPSTGDAGIAAFAVLALIALAGVVVVKKAR